MAAAEPFAGAAEDLPRELVFVDLETTGGNAAHHRITEVGIVRVVDGRVDEEWSQLVNPGVAIPPSIQAFTGISDAMVADAPTFAQIAAQVRARLAGAVFVAHNARFDYSFLRAEFRRLQINFTAKVLCTVKLSRRLFPGQPRHGLDAIIARHGLACEARHRALGDARVLKDFWFELLRSLPRTRLAEACAAVFAAARLPAHLPPGLADELPEGPGVYRFLGEDDALLYIGKSNSLRTRVLAHFAGEHADSKEQRLARLTRRVDWVETAGELGALLLESQWIKQHQPAFNRRLRQRSDGYTLRIEEASGAVETLCIADLSPREFAACRGVFHTAKDAAKALAELARAHQLCAKVMGIEKSAGSCFAYQVGKCRGACVGKEALELHGVRVGLALLPLKLKSWPFPGRIALAERAARWGGEADEIGTDMHVLDHWTYVGTARSAEELDRLVALDRPAAFDVDVYRVLSRWLERNPRARWHDLSVRRPCP